MAEEADEISEISTTGLICPICEANDPEEKLVKKLRKTAFETLKTSVTTRVELGEIKWLPLKTLLQDVDWRKTTYHAECRKELCNSFKIQRLRKRSVSNPSEGEPNILSPPKRGRPSKAEAQSKLRPSREDRIQPKEKKCIFSANAFCSKSMENLHQVMTPAKGLRLLKIKQQTTDDKVRASLSNLHDNLDAQAQEKWYHDVCMLQAENTCKTNDENSCDKIVKQLCDSEIVIYVKEFLKHENEMLTMNHLNKLYISSLQEKGLDVDVSHNFKKRIKDLLQKNVPFIEFITPDRKNESQYVTSKQVVSSIVDSCVKSNDDSYELFALGNIFRHEALLPEYRKWEFTGDFSTWKNPPVFEYVVKQAMFNGRFEQLSDERKAEGQKSIDVVCQVFVQNVKSDRQVRFEGKGTFNQTVETPLSVGIPLCVHSRSRDFSLVKNLSDVYIGEDYRKLIDLEKRIEYAVLDRCSKTGFLCIPDFVKKDVNLWFAIDNVDFLEATAYGQHTLHGCLIVIFQHDEDG